MASKTKPDEIIQDLGGCGRYQMRISVVGHLMKLVVAWSMTSMVLYAKTPPWWCDDADEQNITVGVNSSITQRNTQINTTQATVELTDLANGNDAMFKSCKSLSGRQCAKYKFGGVSTIVNEFDLVCDLAYIPSLIMSIQSVGSLVGNLIAGQMSDLFGRKRPLFGSIVCITIFNFVCYISNSWTLFAASRFFVGLGASAFMTALYSLLSEFSLAQHRAWIIGVPSWPIEASILAGVAYWLKDWKSIQLACTIVGLPFLLTWWIMPESFRWYMAHDRHKDAENVLRKVAEVNRKQNISLERLESIAGTDTEEAGDRKYTFFDIFRSRYLIKLTLLMTLNWFALGFVSYGIKFGIQSLSGNLYMNLFLFSVVGIPAKALTIWSENRIGRRKTAILCFLVIAIGGYVAGIVNYIDTPKRGALINGFALLASIGMAMTWGPVQTMTIELYPTVIRSIGFGTLSTFSRVGAIIGPQFVYLSTKVPGLLFLSSGVIATLCMIACLGLDETKNAKLNDKISETK